MHAHVHHVHIFTEDINTTVLWWTEKLGGKVAFDSDFGGSRNVFMRVGEGRIHFYDQRPHDSGKGAIHHIGIRSENLRELHAQLIEKGVKFRSDIREFGSWRYIMCMAPDNVLLELFEIDRDTTEPKLASYFLDPAPDED